MVSQLAFINFVFSHWNLQQPQSCLSLLFWQFQIIFINFLSSVTFLLQFLESFCLWVTGYATTVENCKMIKSQLTCAKAVSLDAFWKVQGLWAWAKCAQVFMLLAEREATDKTSMSTGVHKAPEKCQVNLRHMSYFLPVILIDSWYTPRPAQGIWSWVFLRQRRLLNSLCYMRTQWKSIL